jgi:glycogen phosphorylase
MKEILESTDLSMSQGAGQQTQPIIRNDFFFERTLPESLLALEAISMNFCWSWMPDGSALFRDLDPTLWEKVEQNPRDLLDQVADLRLWQKANEPAYTKRLSGFVSKRESYLAEEPVNHGRLSHERPAAYFCAEYGVHNSLPIYSGGLGILAGDHLKSASDMRVPLVAIGLFYRFGFFRQKISHEGWQQENYVDSLGRRLALEPVMSESGERITVSIQMRGREVAAQAWLAQIGRVNLYLLDTNVEQNSDVDRLVTGHLYGGDTETRIVQEKLLGIGGVRLLRRLGIEPSVYHLNEGHSAFLTLELARDFLAKNPEADFAAAAGSVRERCVFTTHTPISAGNDTFPTEELEDCFDEKFISDLRLSKNDLFALGRVNPEDQKEWFGMTPLALRMCRSANGVSAKHGQVSRELWHTMYPDRKAAEVPITSVTNGVHAPTWIAPTFQEVYEAAAGPDWTNVLRDYGAWREVVEKIPEELIWKTHQALKSQLIAFIRDRTFSRTTGRQDTINEHKDVSNLFDVNVLTVGFARRVAGYKRWNLLLSDPERLWRLIGDTNRPVQFVFAGKAHPQDQKAKKILQGLMNQKQNEVWFQRAVFIEDYDQRIARYLVHGVDVWLNVPRRPLEASGTSGEKAAMNGLLNVSILDGWWMEGYNGVNGFAIGDDGAGDPERTEEEIDSQDADDLYNILENEVVPAYYNKADDALPREWLKRMKDALVTLTPQFSSDRMLRDYLANIYG